MAKKRQAAADAFSDDPEEDDDEQISGESSGAIFRSIENPSHLTFKEIAAPTPSEKQAAFVFINRLVEAISKKGYIHEPSDPQDLREGFMVMKLFIKKEQDLIKHGTEQLEKAGTTLAYIQENQATDTKAHNKEYCFEIYQEGCFSTANFKHIIMRFCFVVPQLADGELNMSGCFKPGPHYLVDSKSPYGCHVKETIISHLSEHPGQNIHFRPTKATPGWFEDLTREINLLRDIHHSQRNRQETITLAVRRMIVEIIKELAKADDQSTITSNVFLSAALFGTLQSKNVQFDLLQNAFDVAWKHLHVRLPTENKGKERNK
jgi:hypothetical protein